MPKTLSGVEMKKRKIQFYDQLYVGDSIKKPEKIIKKLKKNAGQLNIYIITPAKGNDLLEIIHAGFHRRIFFGIHGFKSFNEIVFSPGTDTRFRFWSNICSTNYSSRKMKFPSAGK